MNIPDLCGIFSLVNADDGVWLGQLRRWGARVICREVADVGDDADEYSSVSFVWNFGRRAGSAGSPVVRAVIVTKQ